MVENGSLIIAMSTLVIAEFCPQDSNDFDKLLSDFTKRPQIKIYAVTRELAENARELTRKYTSHFHGQGQGLKGADAVHLATAIHAKTDKFFTYDNDLLKIKDRVTEIKICEPRWEGQLQLFE
jgi:predicted nucleic acid-binding protein